MSEYNFREIEKKWQKNWEDSQLYKANHDTDKPKYYVLDMFPYPSGAGLHVGHPLGYIASDIVSRYKRLHGFNVLHPMGFDAFGLPAEQYAIQTGQHPAITTDENISRYKKQLKNIGFSFDWSKELRTSEPGYYKWTQWIFQQLFQSWYNKSSEKAESIETLVKFFEEEGNINIKAASDEDIHEFSADDWNRYSDEKKREVLLQYRLAFLADTTVNWCPELGTVLANEEVKDGLSERGGFPVVRKKMKQWSLRISAYAERLLKGLDTIDWPEPVKEMQRNWIGRSIGAELEFNVVNSEHKIKVFTTRIDTIYGVTYLALAPESDLATQLTTPERRPQVSEYIESAKNRSERDRMSDVKTITGTFTGSYAINPFNNEQIPVWIADYVLAGYGTGAVMAVPASDIRDYNFAKHFDLPIVEVIAGGNIEEGPYEGKEGKMINSGSLDGLEVKEAMEKAIEQLEEWRIGKGKIMYRMRDAIFSRQRYWGEPFPVYFKNDIPYLLPEEELPLVLPEVDAYKPTVDGDPPLARADNWKTKDGYPLELSTMPGWAGSSWYFFRYMDSQNDDNFVSKEAQEYWENVDLYIGGSEHATGHLLYSRFWTKFLYDLGYVTVEEPFKKLINQGMIQGRSNYSNYIKGTSIFLSSKLTNLSNLTIKEKVEASIVKEFGEEYYKNILPLSILKYATDVNLVNNDVLNIDSFKEKEKSYFPDPFFIKEADGKFMCDYEIEKMSKRLRNVVNPDDIVEQYGADTLRLYEMFLGPLEQFKPWNTNGIDGVFKFLKKLWRLFHDDNGNINISEEAPSKEALKIVHKTIKKVGEDIERLSFNTSVSTFMICVNELTAIKANNKAILSDLVVALSPYAPHISEELWQMLGHTESISNAKFPEYNEAYLQEDTYEYPISVNGKMRAKMSFSTDKPVEEIQKEVLASDIIQKWTKGKTPKKVIIVPKKIVNIVV